MEKKSRFTPIIFLFIAYISILSCKTTNTMLYGGYILIMSMLLLRVLFDDGGRLIVPSYTKRLLLFIGYSVASIFWAFSSSFVTPQIPLLLACGLLVVMMGDYVIKKNAEDAMLMVIAVCGLAVAIYVIYDYGGFVAFYREATMQKYSLEAQRLGSDVNNVNVIGLQCCFSTLVLFYYALVRKKKGCFLWMLIPAVTTFATGSRKSFVILILGMMVVIYYKLSIKADSKKYIKIYFGMLAMIALVVFILSLDISQTSTERLLSSFNLMSDTKSADGSSQLRFDMIKVGLKYSLQNPVLGWGLANSRAVNALYLGCSMYSHCDYVELLVNGGLIGFLLYYGLLFKLLQSHIILLKKNREDSVVFMSMLILIMMLATNVACVTYYGSISTFVYLTLWISVIEIRKRDEGNEISSKSSEQINKFESV